MCSQVGTHAALGQHAVKLYLSLLATLLLSLAAHAQDLSSRVLAEMNLARTAPQSYARLLAEQMNGYRGVEGAGVVQEAIRFLERADSLAPLALSGGMSQAAEGHVAEQGARGARGHGGQGGSSPWSRMGRYGQWVGSAGENIYYGQRSARGIVCALIVDDNVRGRGHRKNIFSHSFRVAGVGYGQHAIYGAMCVVDFAGGFVEHDNTLAKL